MNPSWIYDVFLSFCHKDTGDSFASDLYTALTAAEIVVFRDDGKLRNQDKIITLTPSVLHAIEGSRISIIVFSINFADSMRCLHELEKIMECGRTIDQVVVPVFYDVDPSGVLHQKGVLGKASKYLKQRILMKNKISISWKKLKKEKLIREASNISGFAVHSR
jgi:hypothetical protein